MSWQTNSSRFPYDPCTLQDGMPCPACTDAAELELQISEAEKALASLKSKRFSTRSQLNHFHSSIIRKIPPEIFSDIFIHCLTRTFIDRSIYAPNLRKGFSPLLLGAVCKLWRTIAWSTPQLWASVSVDLSRPRLSTIVQLAKQWIVRSGHIPLSIRLLCKIPSSVKKLYEIIDSDDVLSLMTDISHSSNRWRDLELSIPSQLMSYIHCTSGSVENLFLEFNSAVQELSRTQFDIGQVDINYRNLTHANLHSFNFRDCLQIIRQAPQLMHCKLYDVRKVDNVPSPVEHPHLRSLSIQRNILDNSSGYFILALIIPSSLEELSYQMSGHTETTASLVNVLAHSSHSLKQLILKDIRTSAWDTDHLLQARCLTHLRIETDNWSQLLPGGLNKLFDELSSPIGYEAQTSPFLPDLEVLEIITLPDQFTWSHVYAIFNSHDSTMMISTFPSRLNHAAQARLQTQLRHPRRALKRLNIEVCRFPLENEYIGLDYVHKFKLLIKQGHDIQFFCTAYDGKEREDLLSLSAGRREWI